MTPVDCLIKHETMVFGVGLFLLEAGEQAVSLYTAAEWISYVSGNTWTAPTAEGYKTLI